MMHSKVIGHGAYLPEKILTNQMFEKMVDTSDEWITTMTGVKERHITRDDEFSSDVATEAAKAALASCQLDAKEIDLILCATITPDMMTPNVACLVQANIGADNAAAMDLSAACSGFIFALSTADAFIKSGQYKTVLVIGVDCLSKITDYGDRTSCILFGDGAGALVLRATEEETGILKTELGSDGAKGMVLTIPVLNVPQSEIDKRVTKDKTMTIWMDGHEVYKFAVKIMADATIRIMDDLGMGVDDIDVLIPHQANIRIVDSATRRLKIDREKVYINLDRVGNMSAACIPIALSEAIDNGLVTGGKRVCLVAMGGGLSWGSAVIEF